ncbi:hypothetical protein CCUS01_15455 [Colletotrichum cuscutae]|uniref:Uncharacterized protein n=1 Tax=Colletotrichum cuscutae TaxID=1209917 RepID=A0AAI9VDX5_9PEZI|nr:hypothetical protein CCUS01_15455 [Colletotrichum cuscutae]
MLRPNRQASRSTPAHDEHYQKGAFNSAIYLDGIGKVYTGEALDAGRDPVPSKPFFSQSPETGIDMVDVSLKSLEAHSTWKLVHRGMEEIVETVFTQIERFCDGRNDLQGRLFYIDEIGLSYPAHWRLEERTRYEKLLRKIMPEFSTSIKPEAPISFHVESLASAHMLFWSRPLIVDIIPPPHTSMLLVFLDFGGYTMNGCMFDVQKSDNDKLSYHRVGETFSAFGGTQRWEQQVSSFCRYYVSTFQKSELPPRQRANLLEQFHREIKKFETGEIEPMRLNSEDTRNNMKKYCVELGKPQAERCFWDALKQPILLAEKKIAEAASLSSQVKIVLSGGSGKNSVIQARLKLKCKSHKIPEPYCLYENLGREDSWNISKGAAIATANFMSVQQAIARGAAYGFQRGGYAPTHGWEEEVEVSLDSLGSRPWKKWCNGKARIKIICDPFLQEKEQHLRFAACCDIIELPQPSRGYWQFTLDIVAKGDDVRLIVARDYMGHNGQKVYRQAPTLELPLYYDPSYCCCLIKTDADDEGFGLLVTESGEIMPCPREPTTESSNSSATVTTRKRKRETSQDGQKSGVGCEASGVQPRQKPSGHLPELKPPGHPAEPRRARMYRSQSSASVLASAHVVEEAITVAGSKSDDEPDEPVLLVRSDIVPDTLHASSRSGRLVLDNLFWGKGSIADSEDDG